MSGTVIELDGTIEDDQSTRILFRVQSDTEGLPDKPMRLLGLTSDDPAFADLARMRSDPGTDTSFVIEAGKTLFDALKRHDNAPLAFSQTFNAPANAPNRTIRLLFRNFGQEVRNLPWEVLYDPDNGFLDVEQGIPIVRVVKTATSATRPLPKLTAGTLRLVAVLAADLIDSHPEYDALIRALRRYNRPWQLRIFTPDQSVHDAAAAEGDSRVEVRAVPETAAELMDAIAEFEPQICHFFCHGLSIGGGRLLVANALTAMGEEPLVIRPSALGRSLPSSAWLVTLNACSSGQSDPNSESASIATGLVRSGVPVVVGMRHETGHATLNTLTKSFLGSALGFLDAALEDGVSFDLDLSACLSSSRGAICEGAEPQRVKEWSLPTITVCAEGFRIQPSPAANEITTTDDALLLAALIGERNALQQFLDRASDSVDDAKRAEIVARVAELNGEIVG